MVVQVDDRNWRVELVGPKRCDRDCDVVVDTKARAGLRLGVVKTAAEVEGHPVFALNRPMRRFNGSPNLAPLCDEDRVHVDVMGLEPKNAPEVFGTRGSVEIRLAVGPCELGQCDQGRWTNLLGANEAFGPE